MATRPVYIKRQKIGEAANYAEAATLASVQFGGTWKATLQWWLRGRRRVAVYILHKKGEEDGMENN